MTSSSKLSRRLMLSALGAFPVLAATTRFTPVQAQRSGDWLPSWNDGPAKSSITDFVARVTSGPDFVPEDQRIATFDNDGTLWIEQPMYVQLAFILDRVRELAPKNPELEDQAAIQGGARRRHGGGGEIRRKGPDRAYGRRPMRA